MVTDTRKKEKRTPLARLLGSFDDKSLWFRKCY